jgi:hypothetical protein
MESPQLSSWQRVKLKHKTGERKKEIENHFGIKSGKTILHTDLETKPEKMLDNIVKQPKKSKSSKKKSK